MREDNHRGGGGLFGHQVDEGGADRGRAKGEAVHGVVVGRDIGDAANCE